MKLYLIAFLLAFSIMVNAAVAKLPVGEKPARSVYLADITKLSSDEQMLFTSIQGIVAQKEPRIFYIRDINDDFWHNYYLDKGYIKKFVTVFDPYELLDIFANEIKGAVIVDRSFPASINVATMIAGMEDYAICTTDLAKKTGLVAKLDLRGMFINNSDAYLWVLNKYQRYFNKKMVCSLEPYDEGGWLRDYLIQHKIFTFWIQSPEAGNTTGYSESDAAVLQQILKERFASNIPIIGNWSSDNDKGLGDYNGNIFAGNSGKYSLNCDWAGNTSLHSGIQVSSMAFSQAKAKPIYLDKTKNYITFTQINAGSSPSYWLKSQFLNWKEKPVPMNWALAPLTVDLYPGILQWYYENAGENDCFFCAMSGMGHITLQYFAVDVPDRADVWKNFLSDTAEYMKRLNLSVISLDTDTKGVKILTANSEYYKLYTDNISSLSGILSDLSRRNDLDSRYANEYVAGTKIPVMHTLNSLDSCDDPVRLAKAIKENTSNDKPGFLNIIVSNPKVAKMVMEQLNADYIFVRADQMMNLFNQYNN